MEPVYPNLHALQTQPGQYVQQPPGQYIQQPSAQPPVQYIQQPAAQLTGPYIQQAAEEPPGPSIQPQGQYLQPQPDQNLEPQGQQSKKTGGSTNVGKATSKGGAYGGSELGSMIGGACCPVVGSIIGNLVGEKVGETVIVETGLDKKVTEGGDKLADVVGKHNVDKLGDIAMTALGYSEEETCVCCPCLPASQILLVLAIPFFFFNFYKLGVGVSWESGCTSPEYIVKQDVEEGSGIEPNSTLTAPNSTLTASNSTLTAPLIYPCQQGFNYLVVSGAVWLTFLPCWICGLFGNCWRQCCCCCCDPVVIGATITDFIKRCCCECGRFNICSFVWYSLCTFHVIWAVTAIIWLVADVAKANEGDFIAPREVWGTVVASVVMDFVLAGSELFHRIRLLFKKNETKEDVETNEQSQKLNTEPQNNQHSSTVPLQGQYSNTMPPQGQYTGTPQ